jgi:hypothetical protein
MMGRQHGNEPIDSATAWAARPCRHTDTSYGTERILSYLTEELVALGHEVTLFASGDSITAANLSPCCTQALRLDSAAVSLCPTC